MRAIYRSKKHAGLKRNFQVMPGSAWLELLCKHISDRYEHLVRYVGWYSNRARGERAKKVFTQTGAALPGSGVEPASKSAVRAKATWARLIRKVYEADPFECPVLAGSGGCSYLRKAALGKMRDFATDRMRIQPRIHTLGQKRRLAVTFQNND